MKSSDVQADDKIVLYTPNGDIEMLAVIAATNPGTVTVREVYVDVSPESVYFSQSPERQMLSTRLKSAKLCTPREFGELKTQLLGREISRRMNHMVALASDGKPVVARQIYAMIAGEAATRGISE